MNSQYFSKEQIKAGELKQLLDFLMAEAYGKGEHYNDIHIYPADCEAFIIEWEQLPWSHDYGGNFKYVDEEQVVMYRKDFPDNHYEYFETEDDFQQALADWLIENPGWYKNEFGRWFKKETIV